MKRFISIICCLTMLMALAPMATATKTLPEVEITKGGTYTEYEGIDAQVYRGVFSIDEEKNYPVTSIVWTVGEMSTSADFDTVISSGTVITGLVITAEDLSIVPEPSAVAVGMVDLSNVSDIYVSKNGRDENYGLSEDTAVATLARAQEIVREANNDMQQDINVHIADGVYTQPETLTFTDADSGTNGYSVNYIGSGNTVISGGEAVTSEWTHEGNGVYSTKVEADTIRELYVNGNKAIRAQSEKRIKPLSMYEQDGETVGFLMSGEDVAAYENASDIQMHYSIRWKSFVLNVKEIIPVDGNFAFIMEENGFKEATKSCWLNENFSFYLENAFEHLDNENEFYYNKANSTLYYKTDKIDMKTAQVYVPKLNQVVAIKGSNVRAKAENISFSKLSFEHCTNKLGDETYINNQAQNYVSFDERDTAHPLDNEITGANVRVSMANNITFKENVFKNLGAVGLGLYDGANNCKIEGNVFYDINDSAITVGLPSHAYVQEDKGYGNEIAIYKKVKASGSGAGYGAYYANDSDPSTGWSAQMTDQTNPYWQVDLGDKYKISRIEISPRPGYDQEGTRSNFAIWASNDPDFTFYTVLATQGATPFSNETGFAVDITKNTKYRYIRVQKTNYIYFYLSEVRVYTSSEEFTPVKQVCTDNVIKNNYITRIGQYNWGAPGIQTYYTDGLKIEHNTIKDVPYSGIALGWGWESKMDSTTSRNNVISDNLIDTFNRIMYDGGAIYTLGQQPDSVVSGNYIMNQINGMAGFYPDQGSADYDCYNNVIENVDVPLFLYGPQYRLNVYDNYANSKTTAYNNKGQNCNVENQDFYIPGAESDTIKAIKENAGLEDEYKYLIDIVGDTGEVNDDIYYNYVNAAEETNGMYPGKLQEYYLKYIIAYSNDMYDAASDTLKATDKYVAFRSAIDAANAVYTETMDAAHQGQAFDRYDVMRARVELKAAIDTFLND